MVVPPLTIPPTAKGETVTVAVLLVVILDEQVPEERLVIVIVLEPKAVNPVAVKVPVPAVPTVIFAVNPVALGLLLL